MKQDNRPLKKRSRCPVCNALTARKLYETPFKTPPIRSFLDRYYIRNKIDFSFLDDDSFIVSECIDCGLLYQAMVLSPEYAKTFYDEWLVLAEETGSRHSTTYYRTLSEELSLISEQLSGTVRPVFLDFGAGWGDWSMMARAYGAEVFGLELSAQKTSYFESQGIRSVHPDRIPDDTFDFINAEQVFEHISNPGEVLSSLVPSLRKGGIIKISVPNGDRVKDNLRQADWDAERLGPKSLMPIYPLEHINCFTGISLDAMAEGLGLRRTALRSGRRASALIHRTIKDLLMPAYRAIIRPFPVIICHYYTKS